MEIIEGFVSSDKIMLGLKILCSTWQILNGCVLKPQEALLLGLLCTSHHLGLEPLIFPVEKIKIKIKKIKIKEIVITRKHETLSSSAANRCVCIGMLGHMLPCSRKHFFNNHGLPPHQQKFYTFFINPEIQV